MGRKRTYHIFLSDDEKQLLHSTINNKKTCKTIIRRCSILLEVDENPPAHLTQMQNAKSYNYPKYALVIKNRYTYNMKEQHYSTA